MAAENEDRPTDRWGKLESIAKVLAGFSAVVSAVLLPIFLNSYTEKNRQAEMFVRTMSEREKSDTDIRQSMFQSLLTGYLGSVKEDFVKADEDSFRRRIVFLELLTINFQEFFNAKPLFEDVYAGLERKRDMTQSDAEKKKWDDLENQIVRVSRNIVSRQSKVLNSFGTDVVFNVDKGESICVRLFDGDDFANLRRRDGAPFSSFDPGRCAEVPAEPKGNLLRHSLAIKPIEVKKAYVTIQVVMYDDVFEGKVFRGSVPKGSLQFDVSYFDLPYMDNTKMSDGSRFSLILRSSDHNSAEIEAIRFRDDFMSLRDRPVFEEMVQKLEKR